MNIQYICKHRSADWKIRKSPQVKFSLTQEGTYYFNKKASLGKLNKSVSSDKLTEKFSRTFEDSISGHQ